MDTSVIQEDPFLMEEDYAPKEDNCFPSWQPWSWKEHIELEEEYLK